MLSFMDRNSPLRPYNLLLGRRWSELEFEEQAAFRKGRSLGLLTLDAQKRVTAK
jgi:hypothetical protein